MRYAIWNNKGGVGKSFLTFALSTEFASQNPDRQVFVIDMCPQANVSEILLGGNGKGEINLQKLLDGKDVRKTIGGYFDTRLASPHAKTGDEGSFPIKVKDFNENIPENLYLIAGDPSLEVQAEAINQIAGQSLPKETWKNVHSWLKDMSLVLKNKFPNCAIFIDCNPSFAAYTELSIVAADKLIVPCTADGSSARAIDNVSKLVYASNVEEQYEDAMFSSRLKKEGMQTPPIHIVILNRSTQYNENASKAFEAMFDVIKKRVNNLFNKEPTSNGTQKEKFFVIPDTHSVAIVACHFGMPVSQIKVKKYEVHDTSPQVNSQPLERYKRAVSELATLV